MCLVGPDPRCTSRHSVFGAVVVVVVDADDDTDEGANDDDEDTYDDGDTNDYDSTGDDGDVVAAVTADAADGYDALLLMMLVSWSRLFFSSLLVLLCQLPSAEEASTAAHKLLTEAATGPCGVAQAPSGRQTRKHVCLHPGCGKVFHFKATADAHQTEHQFLERLGEWKDAGAFRESSYDTLEYEHLSSLR